MASFTLNGYALPVTSVEDRYNPIATPSRSFTGTYRTHRRAFKRAWMVQTPLLTASEAYILERMLLGDGDGWDFAHSFASAKGKYTTSFPHYLSYDSNVPADGFIGATSKFNRAMFPSETETNEFTTNQATVDTDTTGFTAVDAATLTRVTAAMYQGSGSLRVVTSAAVNGVRGGVSIPQTAANTTNRIMSAYVMASASSPTVTVRVYVRNETTATDGSISTYTIPAHTWTRVYQSFVGHSASDTLALYIIEDTADSGLTYFVDACQMEATTNTDPAAWGTPTNTGTRNTSVAYSLADHQQMTINMWATRAGWNGGYLLNFRNNVTATTLAVRTTATNNVRLSILDDNSVLQDLTATSPWTAAYQYKMLTFIIRSNATPHYEIWVDGVQTVTGNMPSGTPSKYLTDTVNTVLGASSPALDTGVWQGLIEDVLILPYVPTAAMILGWYNLNKPLARWPRMWLSGDEVPEGPVLVHPKLENSAFREYQGTSFENAARSLTFTLEEV